jgi:hypothetical protein
MQLDERGAMLCKLAKRLQRPEIRASADEVACLLADEFFEFGASGAVWTRQQVIDGLPREQMQPARELDASDFLYQPAKTLTYRVMAGEGPPSTTMPRESLEKPWMPT